MAELKNAQRVTYKATYNQISPTATVRGTTDAAGGEGALPLRAFDKAAFVQSLRIVADELPILKKATSSNAAGRAAYAAVEGLVNDRTASSTLNNAAAFAKVDPQALVAIATALKAHRKSVADGITSSVAGVLAAFRDSLASAPAPGRARPCVRRAPRRAEGQRHRARHPDPHDGRPRHAGTQVPRSGGHGAPGAQGDDRDRRDEAVAVGVLAEPRGRGARDPRTVEGRGARLGVPEPAEAVLRPRHEASAVPRADAGRARRGRRARGRAERFAERVRRLLSTTPRCTAPPPASSRG